MESEIQKYFCRLVSIDSESLDERAMMDALKADLASFGAEIFEDDTHSKTGGNAGNLFARIPGSVLKPPILLCAHVDTVVPGKGIKPQIQDGKICSDGTTILGSDDKSGVAQIMMGIKAVLEQGIDHAPIEILFTVSEEIGLLGAKYFDKSKIQSAFGYAFDAQNIGDLFIAAPSQNSFKIVVKGKEAHAGVEPEKGINAIRVAAEAIAAMPTGRIDFETTVNIGKICGGMATNIVPNQVVIQGEARSHNDHKLEQVCADVRAALETTVARYQFENVGASFEYSQNTEYKAFRVEEDSAAVKLAKAVLHGMNLEVNCVVGGGGSDANIISAAGTPMIIVGTGMNRYHTVNEYIEIADLEAGQTFVTDLIKKYSQA